MIEKIATALHDAAIPVRLNPTSLHLKVLMQFLRTSAHLLTFFLMLGMLGTHSQQSSRNERYGAQTQAPPLSLQQVAGNLEERNAQRAAALKQFTCRRIYHMQYHGFAGTYAAQMVVDMTYRAPNVKEFKVVSQSGSTFVIDHVFKKLMQGEQEYLDDVNRQQVALNTQNYDFSYAGYENTPNGAQYVLNISPRTKNKFLYRGRIWVDAKDFAVVHIKAEPAENPSIWIKKTIIEHNYKKVGDFWLPASDHTESDMRLGGQATLSIDYQDYRITQAFPLPVQRARIESR